MLGLARRDQVRDGAVVENQPGRPGALSGAIEDALAQYGVRCDELPLTPRRVRELVRAGARGAGLFFILLQPEPTSACGYFPKGASGGPAGAKPRSCQGLLPARISRHEC